MNWHNAIKFDGLSDHTDGILAPILFSGLIKKRNLKQIIIEKHVKLSDSKSLDASTSIDTKQFKIMNQSIRSIEKLKIF